MAEITIRECLHETLGFPPKLYWELRPCRVYDKKGKRIIEEEYTCYCLRVRGVYSTIRRIPEDNEWWDKEGHLCPSCGKEKVLKHIRTYYRKCNECGERWYI